MKYHNLLLVQPANDEMREKVSRSNVYPPLGLLSIATYLRQILGDKLHIRVIDLSINEPIDISILLEGVDIVGITSNSFNYMNTLNIARMAKEKGATVVLGGVHARALNFNILNNRSFIDYVVDGEGEIPMLSLVKGENPHNILNLVFRNNDSVICNENMFHDISKLPIIDRDFINIEKYINNYSSINIHNFDYERPTSVYTHKGCRWRDISGGCIFCARKDTKFQARPIEQIWREILELHRKYNIDYIWNVADDFLADMKWVKKFVSKKPEGLNIRFLIYTRSDNITNEAISIMNELCVHEVLVGFESGDSDMLVKSRKGCNIRTNLNAVKILGSSKIKLYPTFILGLPGENTNSIKKTINFMHHVMGNCEVSRLVVSIMIPFPGSGAYQKLLLNAKLREKYLLDDEFNLDEIIRDWIDNFTDVSIDEIKSHISNFSCSGYKQNDTCNSEYSFEFLYQ